MGFRVLVDKRKGAALNLFSRTPNLFDLESAGRAAVLASFTSVAINAVAREKMPLPFDKGCSAIARSARPSAC